MGTGFGVLVAASVADAVDDSLVDVELDVPQAANSMEMMKVMVSSFFISSVPSFPIRGRCARRMLSPTKQSPYYVGDCFGKKQERRRNTCAARDLLNKSCRCDDDRFY